MKRFLILLVCAALAACSASALAEASSGPSLPAYVYPGDDPLVGAVANYIAENAPPFWDDSRPTVVIPLPLILKTVAVDETHTDVYGGFWRLRYTLEGSTLVCVSGGEAAGIMRLELTDQGWTVASVETAGDGDVYPKDIVRFCQGDKALEKAYFDSSDIRQEQAARLRAQFIRDYVEANQLPIDSYQNPYWDAVPLFE